MLTDQRSLTMENNENNDVVYNDIEWDTTPHQRSKNSNAIRISKHKTSKTARMSFPKAIVQMLCGRNDSCYLVFGLSKDKKNLYIKIANSEDKGARRINKEKKFNGLTVRWLGVKLNVTNTISFVGIVEMIQRDMFIAKLQKEVK
jgi:hypothetical protein